MWLSDDNKAKNQRGKGSERAVCVCVCVCVQRGVEGRNLASSLPNWGQIQLFAETTWKSLRIVPAGAPNLAAIALAALEGPFILEGKERLRRCTCMCVYVWAHLSCRGMSRGTRTPWEATRSLPIWDQRQREGEISLTLPCAESHTLAHTHACMCTMYQCNERRQISFSFGDGGAQKLHKYVYL